MPGFHIDYVMLKYLMTHKKGAGGRGPPLNPPLINTNQCPDRHLKYRDLKITFAVLSFYDYFVTVLVIRIFIKAAILSSPLAGSGLKD